MTDTQKQFLANANAAALKANHVFPKMAACEAALESSWGNSQLAREGNNLFGMKVPKHPDPTYGVLELPTWEVIDGKRIETTAHWVKYPAWSDCFSDRMYTLQRLAPTYPHYKAALEAGDPESYVKEVSKTWSTDPERARKVISIFQEFLS